MKILGAKDLKVYFAKPKVIIFIVNFLFIHYNPMIEFLFELCLNYNQRDCVGIIIKGVVFGLYIITEISMFNLGSSLYMGLSLSHLVRGYLFGGYNVIKIFSKLREYLQNILRMF